MAKTTIFMFHISDPMFIYGCGTNCLDYHKANDMVTLIYSMGDDRGQEGIYKAVILNGTNIFMPVQTEYIHVHGISLPPREGGGGGESWFQ